VLFRSRSFSLYRATKVFGRFIMELYQHQKEFLEKNPDKTSLVWSCGTSKTRTALEWSKLYNGTTLAIVPKGLVTNWKREMDKWNIQIDVLSKENFRKLHKTLKRYDQIICDEIHNGFLTPGFKSQMSKSLRWYLKYHKINRFLACSATIFTSSPWNIYNLAYYTGHEWDYMKFKWTFFYDVMMGMRTISMPKKGIEGKLAELTKKIASVVNIADVMDVPLQNHCDPEYFSLTKQQEKAIEENYDPAPIVRYTAQHEIENGIFLGNEFREEKTFPCDKNDRILQLVEENKKIAIVCRYNYQIENLARLLEAYKPLIISGKTENRDKVCLEAESADRAVVLIQADCGIGFQLPSFELCVYVSMSYSYTAWEQMNGRFLRMDKPSRTTFMYLLTEGDSIDQAVFDAVKRREDFKIELYGNP
jgi:superfamily II DNA or RNA helicase